MAILNSTVLCFSLLNLLDSNENWSESLDWAAQKLLNKIDILTKSYGVMNLISTQKMFKLNLVGWGDMSKLGTVPVLGHEKPLLKTLKQFVKNLDLGSWFLEQQFCQDPTNYLSTILNCHICNLLNNLTETQTVEVDHWQHVLELPERSEQSAT